jgi:hypothetical protein
MTPPRKASAFRRIRRTLALVPTLGADASGPLSVEELMTNSITPLPLNLSINHATQIIVASIGMVRRQPVVLVDVMPDGRVCVHLIIKGTEHHVLFWSSLHAQQTNVPFMKERNKIVVSHLEVLKHSIVIHANISRVDVIVSMNHPEELPPLHKNRLGCQLALFQSDMKFQRSDQFFLKSEKELAVKRCECTAVGELLKSGPLFSTSRNHSKASCVRVVALDTLRPTVRSQSLNVAGLGRGGILISSLSFTFVPPAVADCASDTACASQASEATGV